MKKLSLLLCLALAVGCATVTRGVDEVSSKGDGIEKNFLVLLLKNYS